MGSSLALGSADERRLAVIDMGSNTFRLVVFRYRENLNGFPFPKVESDGH